MEQIEVRQEASVPLRAGTVISVSNSTYCYNPASRDEVWGAICEKFRRCYLLVLLFSVLGTLTKDSSILTEMSHKRHHDEQFR